MHTKILLRESPYTHPWGSTPLYKPYTYVPPQRAGYAKATCGLIVESNSLAVFNSSYSPTYCSYELPDVFYFHTFCPILWFTYFCICIIRFYLLSFYPSIVYILWSFLSIVGAMSVTDFTNLINVDVDVFVVSTLNESEGKSNNLIRNGF